MRFLIGALLTSAAFGVAGSAAAQMGSMGTGSYPMGSPLIGSGPAPTTDRSEPRARIAKPADRKKRKKTRG